MATTRQTVCLLLLLLLVLLLLTIFGVQDVSTELLKTQVFCYVTPCRLVQNTDVSTQRNIPEDLNLQTSQYLEQI